MGRTDQHILYRNGSAVKARNRLGKLQFLNLLEDPEIKCVLISAYNDRTTMSPTYFVTRNGDMYAIVYLFRPKPRRRLVHTYLTVGKWEDLHNYLKRTRRQSPHQILSEFTQINGRILIEDVGETVEFLSQKFGYTRKWLECRSLLIEMGLYEQ